MKYRDLKFGTKQTISFSIVLLIMVGTNIFSIHKMFILKAEVDQVSTNWLPRTIAISDINLSTSHLRSSQLQHAIATDEVQKQKQVNIMIALIDSINRHVDIYEKLKKDSEKRNIYSEEEGDLYIKCNEKLEEYQDLSIEFFTLSRENRAQEAIDLLNHDARVVYNDFSSILTNLVSVNKKDAQKAAKRVETMYRHTRAITIGLLVVTILLSIFIATILVQLITTPLKQLERAVKSVAGGDLDVQLNILSKDEIGNLAHSFNQMTLALHEGRKRIEQESKLRAETAELRAKITEAESKVLKAEFERKTHELEQARELQLSMLPKKIPQIPGLDIATYMQPAKEVGGDYYDFKLEKDKALTIVIGDATGHGLNAGTMVAATKSLFNALSHIDPAQFLNKVSKVLQDMGFQDIFMTLMMARLKSRKLILSSAAMPYTLIYRVTTGNVEEIKLDGLPLGSFPDSSYQTKEISLQAGDTILFMTDGLPEMFNAKDEMFGYERTKRLFKEVKKESPKQVIDHLVKAGKDWMNGHTQNDDITFVSININ